ncbi:MAG: hypothetical protein J5I92_11280 [Thiogranum sp.]|nr:hypothetical protein [Thiogranum sp.]
MKRILRIFLSAAVSALLLYLAANTQSAPPVRDKVLADVEIIKSDGNLVIEVHFSFPLRYRSHFPLDQGDELRIRLEPLLVPPSDLDALFQREAVTPQYTDSVALDQVIYEGDIEGGPYLTVRFTRDARYEVIAGADYRSVRIVVLSIE